MVGIQKNFGVVWLDADSVLDTYLIMSMSLIVVSSHRGHEEMVAMGGDLNSGCCDEAADTEIRKTWVWFQLE